MTKFKLTGLSAVFFVFLIGCDSGGGEVEASLTQEEKINTTQTNITVTFVNSWAGVNQALFPDDYPDDPLTGYGATVDVYPAVLRGVVDTDELNNYNEDKENYDRINAAWEQYKADLAAWDGVTEELLPTAPTEDPVPEPVYPTVTLPYFPGTPFTNDRNKEAVFGARPSWDYHYLQGWEIVPNYPSRLGEPAPYELTLQTKLTKNVTAVPKWVPVPSAITETGPFVTVTFEKNDGSGLSDIKFATNPNITYYEADKEKFKFVDFGQPVNGKYRTSDSTFAKLDTNNAPIVLGYEGFTIQGFVAPVNERPYYTAGGWKTSLDPDLAVTIIDLPTQRYSADTFIYQRWEYKPATIHFNVNLESYPGLTVSNSISDMIGPQAVFAQSGVKGTGQSMPVAIATDGTYSFTGWNTNAEGTGTTVGNSSKIKESDITLYAQYTERGYASIVIPYTGRAFKWIAPIDAAYKFALSGGRGGFTTENSYAYGKGGSITATVELEAGTVLYFYIGGAGNAGTVPNGGGSGGWNGGGNGTNDTADVGIGGGGGGATDIRTIPAANDLTKWNNAASLASRILVAGGGGGAIFTDFASPVLGYTGGNGAAGIANGGSGKAYVFESPSTIRGSSAGGTLISGQAAGADGTTGVPSWSGNPSGSGGGGGGYHGAAAAAPGIPGAGGSSWASENSTFSYQIRKMEGGREVFENRSETVRFTSISTAVEGGGRNDGDGKIVISYSLIPEEEEEY
ncbi:MAG: InlB B-repeat-containing protein [Spirochaetaceae bacterium]|jgi:hypothetical protein|nr:InlB B-repeat-containing protein [Spirochaetaceae bacterium]